jgi:hypothetical protein
MLVTRTKPSKVVVAVLEPCQFYGCILHAGRSHDIIPSVALSTIPPDGESVVDGENTARADPDSFGNLGKLQIHIIRCEL